MSVAGRKNRFKATVRDAMSAGQPAGTAIKLGLQTGKSHQVFDRRLMFRGAMKDCMTNGKATRDAIRTALDRLGVTRDTSVSAGQKPSLGGTATGSVAPPTHKQAAMDRQKGRRGN